MVIRNMGFTVDTKNCTVGINNGNAVIKYIYITFIKADWKDDAKLGCNLFKMLYGRIVLYGCSI